MAKAGQIAARVSQVLHEIDCNGIGDECEYDGYRVGQFFEGSSVFRADHDQQIRGGGHEERRRSAHSTIVFKQRLYTHVAPLDPPEPGELLPEYRLNYSETRDKCDTLYLISRLGPCHDRACRRAAERRNEIASPHPRSLAPVERNRSVSRSV